MALLSGTITGLGTDEGDLWCTYAAIRTLSWLGRLDEIPNRADTVDFLLSKRNTDGGYAWSRGMTSDAWATFYCTQALRDLGHLVPDIERTAEWLSLTWSGEAYAMTPGQAPDVWATHFSTRTAIEICGVDVPDRDRLIDWLRRLQSPAGGVSWTPEHAVRGIADVRACHYATTTFHTLAGQHSAIALPWRTDDLIDWIQHQQLPDGGFRFAESATEACMWATFRATAALAWLDAAPAEPVGTWIARHRGSTGAYVRWDGYDVEDVWASFCAVGALRASGEHSPASDAIAALIATMAVPSGGFTYRETGSAADVLTSAAAILAAPDSAEADRLRAWIPRCLLPNEGGVMYMPGRGAEVRSTLWALSAGAFERDERARRRIGAWLTSIQNPDGGFGYWEGRGSDLVSTAAAVEIAVSLSEPIGSVIDIAALAGFVGECRTSAGEYGSAPGSQASARAGLQASRIFLALGDSRAGDAERLLQTHRVRGGGWANDGNRVPDLLSTYEAVVTADRLGIALDTEHVHRFVDRISAASGFRWSPLAANSGGALAHCLGSLLRKRLSDRTARLPALTLS
ncbi:prenyltransferase/squalene oxidase repeat-containing protein [Nocardia aurantiaca]|uniref:prenyltransferase/squalene oxidase repeat-containing protein n=1 Tax=Nocardia aurantiaca TaxID=2675850 RepID=UPI002E239F99|nr:prenyltransferase/squalene oxidase repeat-containing protein [Nocardia aurantiaca]